MSQSILFHIIVMALGVTVLLGAGYIGKTDKGGRNLNTHKAVAAVGIMLVLVEVVALILTKALMLTLPHFFIAAAAIAFMLLAPDRRIALRESCPGEEGRPAQIASVRRHDLLRTGRCCNRLRDHQRPGDAGVA